MKPFPRTAGGFPVIYADPCWDYANTATRAAAEDHYPTLTLDELAALPVRSAAAENAVLFLWTTWPFMPDALQLAEAWGFRFKTCAFLWAKRNRVSNTPFFGMGNWTRANTEPCLLFTRGAPKRASAAVPQFIWSPVARHSEKPAAVRDRIVRLCGDIPRLELFARHRTRGWRTWGNELLPKL